MGDLRSLPAILGPRKIEGGLRVGWPFMFLTKGGLVFIEGGLRVGWLLSFFVKGGLPIVIGRKTVGWVLHIIGLTCRLLRPITFSSALIGLLDAAQVIGRIREILTEHYRTFSQNRRTAYRTFRSQLSDVEPNAKAELSDVQPSRYRTFLIDSVSSIIGR